MTSNENALFIIRLLVLPAIIIGISVTAGFITMLVFGSLFPVLSFGQWTALMFIGSTISSVSRVNEKLYDQMSEWEAGARQETHDKELAEDRLDSEPSPVL